MSYASILDDLRASSTEIGSEGLAKIWPNQWYEAYTKDVQILFYPGLSCGGTSLGRTEAWSEHAHSYSYQLGVSTQYRTHYIKVGVESRRTSGMAYYPTLSHFNFSAETTADTFVSPDTSLSGDPYASFLLGVPTGDSTAHYTPRPEVSLTSYGAYFQDDWKISSRLTLNLGLRYEYQTPQREEQDRISREMVLAFGLDHIIISADRPKDPAASRYLENTATTRGKPSITAEAGHAGTVETEDVEALVRGCLSVMRYLKMLPGAPITVENPVWVESVLSVTSDAAGIFYPLVKKGTYVAKDMPIGYVTDFFGQKVFEAKAPGAGVVLYVCSVPTMTKGGTIANVGVVRSGS